MMWILITLAAVLVLKAHTSRETERLHCRIHEARKALREAQEKKRTVAERRAAAEDALKQMEFRVQQMKEVIADLKNRLEDAERNRPPAVEAPLQTNVVVNV